MLDDIEEMDYTEFCDTWFSSETDCLENQDTLTETTYSNFVWDLTYNEEDSSFEARLYKRDITGYFDILGVFHQKNNVIRFDSFSMNHMQYDRPDETEVLQFINSILGFKNNNTQCENYLMKDSFNHHCQVVSEYEDEYNSVASIKMNENGHEVTVLLANIIDSFLSLELELYLYQNEDGLLADGYTHDYIRQDFTIDSIENLLGSIFEGKITNETVHNFCSSIMYGSNEYQCNNLFVNIMGETIDIKVNEVQKTNAYSRYKIDLNSVDGMYKTTFFIEFSWDKETHKTSIIVGEESVVTDLFSLYFASQYITNFYTDLATMDLNLFCETYIFENTLDGVCNNETFIPNDYDFTLYDIVEGDKYISDNETYKTLGTYTAIFLDEEAEMTLFAEVYLEQIPFDSNEIYITDYEYHILPYATHSSITNRVEQIIESYNKGYGKEICDIIQPVMSIDGIDSCYYDSTIDLENGITYELISVTKAVKDDQYKAVIHRQENDTFIPITFEFVITNYYRYPYEYEIVEDSVLVIQE